MPLAGVFGVVLSQADQLGRACNRGTQANIPLFAGILQTADPLQPALAKKSAAHVGDLRKMPSQSDDATVLPQPGDLTPRFSKTN